MRITEELISSFRDYVTSHGGGNKLNIVEGFMDSCFIGVHDIDTMMYLMALIPKIRKGIRRVSIASSNKFAGGAV